MAKLLKVTPDRTFEELDIRLTFDECVALHLVLNRIGGSPDGMRGLTSKINTILNERLRGFDEADWKRRADLKGEIYFGDV